MTGSSSSTSRLLATCLGDCVHVAGVRRFLGLAAEAGYETRFLGAAQPLDAIAAAVDDWQPDILALSYRLTPEALERLLEEAGNRLGPHRARGMRLIFGGPDPNCEVAKATGFCEATFGGSSNDEVCRAWLRGEERRRAAPDQWPQNLVTRIEDKSPLPLLRHHFGQPTVEVTVSGAREIAKSGVLDVLSLGPDQNAQASFFRPQDMDPAQDGAGGVPIRTEDDLNRIYEATRIGNKPLVRCYSGTRDVLRMAEVLRRTINNAWAAIPLFWYNVLDRRSDRPLRQAIAENQAAIAWHARAGVPVEVNDSHQWSLRSAPDAVAVASFFLAAYNAKSLGVRDYVGQLMFNTPAGTAPNRDLAKMLAKLDLAGELEDEGFRIWRQTRTGLASLPADRDAAIGHLCGSVAIQLAVKPHIVHVVGYSEASHAATAADVVSSVRMARGTIEAVLQGLPEMTLDPGVTGRRDQLLREARLLLAAVKQIAPWGTVDPWADPETLARAVECGLLDASDLAGNPNAAGTVVTAMIDGASLTLDERGLPLSEERRVAHCLELARSTWV